MVKKFKNTRAAMKRVRRISIIDDLYSSLIRLLSNPASLSLIIVAFVLTVTHSDDKMKGFVHEYAKNHDMPIVKFLSNQFDKIIGFLLLASGLVVCPRRSSPVLFGIVAVASIVVLPVANFYQYSAVALIMNLFCQAKYPLTRTLCIAAGFLYVMCLHNHMDGFTHLSKLNITRSPSKRHIVAPDPSIGQEGQTTLNTDDAVVEEELTS